MKGWFSSSRGTSREKDDYHGLVGTEFQYRQTRGRKRWRKVKMKKDKDDDVRGNRE